MLKNMFCKNERPKAQNNGKSHASAHLHLLSSSFAFTLAEVLITLGIIGVVAAMTIPTLINNYSKNQAVTRYKKTFAVVSQAINLAEADNGMSQTWEWTGTGASLTQFFADNYFYPYIKTIKKCESGSLECWKAPVSLSNTSGYLNPQTDVTALSAVLSNGASIFFWTGEGTTPHAQIWVDIDGPSKGRNMLGMDVFGIHFNLGIGLKKGVWPKGTESNPALTRDQMKSDASSGCNSSSTGTLVGRYCAGLIAVDNWQIKDDYPWK